MKGKKKHEAKADSTAEAIMDELLGNPGDGSVFDFAGVDFAGLGRLTTECCRHGLLVSYYLSSSDNALVLSIRAGDKRRSYQAFDAQELKVTVDGLIKTLSGGLRKVK